MKIKRIVFDLTTSYYWRGIDVGITRTEKAIAKILMENLAKNTIFCYFCKKNNKFIKMNQILAHQLINNQGIIQHSPYEIELKPPIVEDMIHYIISNRIIKKIVRSLISPKYHSVTLGFFNDIKKYLYCTKSIKKQYANFNNLQKKTPANLELCQFNKGDLYISLGLDWDKENLPKIYSILEDVSIKTILFCYDLIPYKLPHTVVPGYELKMMQYFADLLWCSSYIITISESAKHDLLDYSRIIGAPKPNIQVINIGCDLLKEDSSIELSTIKSTLLNKDFVLSVSTIEPRKNYITIYNAWRKLYERNSKNLPMLVIVGREGWLCNDLVSTIKNDINLSKFIIILSNVNDSELLWLYKNCLFTIFPSLYEGWGLPVAESLFYGKYCISSNASSLPEVTQGLTKLIDPYDIYSWVNEIANLIEDKDKLKSLEENIKVHYNPQTYHRMSMDFLDFLSTKFDMQRN